jgi:hypothetical protein
MGAERRGHRPRGRRCGAAVALVVTGMLVSACASMPDDGTVESVHRAEPDSQVRVFGVSPQEGEGPQQIVRGFLEATTSDEAAFATAKEYMTRHTAERWDPFARTTVLSNGPSPRGAVRDLGDGSGPGGYTVEVTGARMAEVDGQHSYAPDKGGYSEGFHLTKQRGEWRIDRLPEGLVLGESDFQRIYRPINDYYYARLGSEAKTIAGGESVLVADPVYLRRRIDPVTETVNSLLAGPTRWLAPVVGSSFPAGSRLAPEQHLSLDDSGSLSLRLNSRGARVDHRRCERMAAQLLHTVQDQASAKVTRMQLAGPHGGRLCEMTREQAMDFEPGRLNGSAKRKYFVDAEHRVAAFAGNGTTERPVEGALGSGRVEMGAVGVNREEREGAGVSRGGRSLYVSRLAPDGELGSPVLTSKAKREKDALSTPSWDGLDDLWTADRDPDHPRLLRLVGGKQKAEEVRVPGLGKGERVVGVRIASDGVRIALRIQKRDGRRTLELGRVERPGTERKPGVRVTGLRPIAPQFEDVASLSWAGGSRLVVVGREKGSVQQLLYLETDGSAPDQPTLPGINDVTGVAASENESKPLLAESGNGIVLLPPDGNWRTLTESGSGPAYPG